DLAAFVVQLLKAVEAVPAVAHDLASLGHVAELLGKLEQAGFGPDDLLVLGHGGVLRCGQQTPSVRLSPDFFTTGSIRRHADAANCERASTASSDAVPASPPSTACFSGCTPTRP